MARRLHYFAQPFWNERRQPAARYEFRCALEAEDGGRILFRSADGVLVYQQWADVEVPVYEDPDILAVLGEVPSAALAIDADGRDPWLDDVA